MMLLKPKVFYFLFLILFSFDLFWRCGAAYIGGRSAKHKDILLFKTVAVALFIYKKKKSKIFCIDSISGIVA